jgi:hypothetical protein
VNAFPFLTVDGVQPWDEPEPEPQTDHTIPVLPGALPGPASTAPPYLPTSTITRAQGEEAEKLTLPSRDSTIFVLETRDDVELLGANALWTASRLSPVPPPQTMLQRPRCDSPTMSTSISDDVCVRSCVASSIDSAERGGYGSKQT